MSPEERLQGWVAAAASVAPQAPTSLLDYIAAVADPLSILASNVLCNDACQILEQDAPGVGFLVSHNPNAESDRLAALWRWLMDGLHRWKREQDPGHRQIVALLTTLLSLGECRAVWNAMPDSVGTNLELIAALEAAVLSSRITISSRQGAPIWEREALAALAHADAALDWPAVADSWRLFETAIIGESFLLLAARGLARFRFDRLVSAVRNHTQTVDCMRLAEGLTLEELLRLAHETTNEHVRFCCVYAGLSRVPQSSRLVPADTTRVTDVLEGVARDRANWRKWLRVFAQRSVRFAAIQVPLGRALATMQNEALADYVDAIDLNVGQSVSRDAVTACLRAFRETAEAGQRSKLWRLAYDRWRVWNFGASSLEVPLFSISRSELDFALVGHAVETMTAAERAAAISEVQLELAAVESIWYSSETDMVTAWFRALSKLQIFAHADHVVSSDSDWLATTMVQLPYRPDDAYVRLRYGSFDRG